MTDNLDKIKLFLKLTGYKKFRYRPEGLSPPENDTLIGKLELVSDGKKVWWEQNAETMKMKVRKKKYAELDWKQYPKLYKTIPYYLDQFFEYFAHKFVEEQDKLKAVEVRDRIDKLKK